MKRHIVPTYFEQIDHGDGTHHTERFVFVDGEEPEMYDAAEVREKVLPVLREAKKVVSVTYSARKTWQFLTNVHRLITELEETG